MAPAGFLLAAVLLAASGSEGMQISQGYQSGEVLLSVAGGASPTARDGKSAHLQTVSLLQTIADSQIGVFNEQVDVSGQGDSKTLVKQLFVPVMALILGLICLQAKGALNTMGKIMVYFGAQTFMNLYMKVVLSNSMVSRELNLKGFPAAFAVTALQQIASFALLLLLFGCLWFTPWRYMPKVLSNRFEVATVICFSLAFTVNIALNNFSLMLLPISVNLIIRSCAPLTTFAAQQIMARLFSEPVRDSNLLEVVCMVVGVGCAAIAVFAKSAASGPEESPETANLLLGLLVCIASLFSASLNMALAGVLGTSLKMNPIDTTLYMSLPSFAFLLVPVFFIAHPSEWPGDPKTDWSILCTVAELNPGVIGLALLSGAFALTYNALQFAIVQTMSPTHAAFASNFNKAATIAIAMVVGLETVRLNNSGTIMLLGIVGNIAAFTVYSMLKADGKKADGKKAAH